ncbi:thioredoxin-like protein [Lactarius psammicola]|nr:thioredoxin-like protein [Lactarius psammicola]
MLITRSLTQTSFNLFPRACNHHIYSPPFSVCTRHQISHIFPQFIPSKPMSTPKDIVENAVAKGQVVIFSKSWCPYSKRAKTLIEKKYSSAELTVFELDEREDGDDLQNYLHTKTGQRTVPNVFIKQKHVGGCDDLFALDDMDGINKLLN